MAAAASLSAEQNLIRTVLSGSKNTSYSETLLEFGRRHHLLPVFFQRNDFEMRTSDEARWEYVAQWKRNQTSLLALKAVGDRLDEIGIPWMVLKGLPLAHELYGDIGTRPVGDADILILVKDWDRTLKLLTALGYEIPCGRLSRLKLWRKYVHALECHKPELKIDLHHNLRSNLSICIDATDIWNRSRWIEFEGWAVRVPHLEDTILILLLSLQEDIGRGTCKVRSFLDLDTALRRSELSNPDRLKRFGVLKIAVNILYLLEQLGGERSWGRDYPDLLEPAPPGLLEAGLFQRKKWALGLYDGSLGQSIAAWLMGLPVRMLSRYWRAPL